MGCLYGMLIPFILFVLAAAVQPVLGLVFLIIYYFFYYLNSKDVERDKLYKIQKIEEIKITNINKVQRYLNNLESFHNDESYINVDNFSFLTVDEKSRLIAIGKFYTENENFEYVVISAKNVLKVEVTEGGKGLLSSSSNANALGMAAIGGLLFGGAGAVVGAISGSDNNAVISSVCIRISIDDIKNPYVDINFLSTSTGRGTDDHKIAISAAEKWFCIISILIDRERRGIGNQQNDSFIENNSELKFVNTDLVDKSAKIESVKSLSSSVPIENNNIEKSCEMETVPMLSDVVAISQNAENIHAKETRSKVDNLYFIDEAKILLKNKSFNDAIVLLTKSINFKYSLSESYYFRAVAYSKLNLIKEARSDLEKSAALGNKKALVSIDKINKQTAKFNSEMK